MSGNAAMALETEGKTLDVERLRRGVNAVLLDASKGFYLVAERVGEVVGQLLVTFEWSDWRDGTFYWVQSVYVTPSARRTGVYRGLYASVTRRARAAGDVSGVRLYVERHNEVARSTYAALGMSRAAYEMFEVDFILGEAKPNVSG